VARTRANANSPHYFGKASVAKRSPSLSQVRLLHPTPRYADLVNRFKQAPTGAFCFSGESEGDASTSVVAALVRSSGLPRLADLAQDRALVKADAFGMQVYGAVR
jgi:hypothetical protein